MTRTIALMAAGLLAIPAQAAAADKPMFAIAGGKLEVVLPQLSREAGVSIAVDDAALWEARVKPVRGRMSVEEGFRRLLAGTAVRAVRISATSWRIERRRARTKSTRASATPRGDELRSRPADRLSASPNEEIVVTASKTDIPMSAFAGVATRIDGHELAFGAERGMETILARVATMSSTHLGPGRNKLFVRGIADSSFTGPTQATVSQYLGDLRLTYNAPDPDLRLYDVASVEVLEGPQGTLYGAGSLGGVMRILPASPDPGANLFQIIAGASLTRHGDTGGDIGAIANVPFGDKGHALRLVGYTLSDGGYIDNPLRGQRDVNDVLVRGGRATLRLDTGAGWLVDLGGVYQAITADDAQYADRDAPALTRSSTIMENAKTRYGLGSVVVTKDWGGLHFQSSTAVVDHRQFERFDASEESRGPRVLDQRSDTRLVSSEMRLSRPFKGGFGWVIGAGVLENRARQTRQHGEAATLEPITGVSNYITELTGYGEAAVRVAAHLTITAGLRVSHARLGGRAEDVPIEGAEVYHAVTVQRSEAAMLPSASLLYAPLQNLSFYARYQEGFRPGGLTIDGGHVRRFRNDEVKTFEAGIRFGDRKAAPFDASLSVSHSRWRDIQADFIDPNGLPTTANIGDGRITSLSAAISVRPVGSLSFEVAGLYNQSRITNVLVSELRGLLASGAAGDAADDPLPAQLFGRLDKIPNVACYALRGSFVYGVQLGEQNMRFSGWANYVGPSRLGIGPILGKSQGRYADTGLAARYGSDARGVSLMLSNIFDVRGNRFALGRPFANRNGASVTPLRPRTVRLAIDIAY